MAMRLAFLRAINLGATRQFPKEAIRAAVESAGGTDVATYINTGNVRFDTSLRSRTRIEAALERAFLADRGFEVPTVTFTAEELRRAVAEGSELHAERGGAGRHYVTLLKSEPDPGAAAELEALSTDDERAVVRGRVVHLMLGEDYRTARLDNARVERALGVGTNRNLTVLSAIVDRWCG
ncbi:DUF1697 domain-containing protein [Nocardioides donggukensis]|uniref:DUF1697 domain-containing protein n=1 Tax=Nocardioides donggukensis TaxID=2774019 RepID=A0A927K2G6_9ACTN|nr:DUF1697 domain-containing protein [Nocardioides donggukensis]MBD8868804.1 DUF1697 domain-containing protein [Nocardioides donggukensis]